MPSYLKPPHQKLEKPTKNLKAEDKSECSKGKKLDVILLSPGITAVKKDGFYFISKTVNTHRKTF